MYDLQVKNIFGCCEDTISFQRAGGRSAIAGVAVERAWLKEGLTHGLTISRFCLPQLAINATSLLSATFVLGDVLSRIKH